MKRTILATLLSGACAVALSAQVEQRVRVAVSVRDGSRSLSGLAAEDFTLTDNDVTQRVQLEAISDIPLDVTLVVDGKTAAANVAERFASDVQQIARLLRKGDALRVIRIDTFVEQLRPMTPVEKTTAPPLVTHGILSSLHDAVIAALVRRTPAERLSLVFAMTDGIDTTSITSADRLREVAARSDATLQIMSVRSATTSNATFATVRPRFRDANALILAEAAEQTGGELRTPGLFGDPDLITSFTRVLGEFRQGYLLSYEPTGVERVGWHELSVSVPRAPNATVRVRRGYSVP